MADISVIMLTYNREKLLCKAVESILRQTFAGFEFIIVDNGSTDNSGVIADNYAKMDSRVKVIHREKGNIGSGRNAGLNEAGGKYFTYIDDDDYAEPEFLEFLYSFAEKENADIAICGSWRENENGITEPKYVFEETLRHSAEDAFWEIVFREHYNSASPTKLYRKNSVGHIRFSEMGRYDDIATTYKFFAGANRIAAKGVPLYTFCRHESNNSSAATTHSLINPEQLYEYMAVFRERTEYIETMLPGCYTLAQWSEWSYMISMIEKIKRYNLQNCAEPLEVMTSELKKNRKAFFAAKWTREFEKEWVNKYV